MRTRYCVVAHVSWLDRYVQVCATDDRQQAEWARQFWTVFGFVSELIGW